MEVAGMTIVRRPSPFGELVSLRQAMDRLFEDSFVRPGDLTLIAGEARAPLDVRLTGDEVIVEAVLPGVKPEETSITIENGTLTITGQTRAESEETEGTWLLREIRRGTFSRAVSLPAGLRPDAATASFEDGVLTVRIPRAEEVKPKQIRITPTSTETGAATPAAVSSSEG
jgi:HSP20 family protein